MAKSLLKVWVRLLVLIGVASAVLSASAQLVEPRNARVTVLPKDGAEAIIRQETLPFRWDRQFPGMAGHATLEMEFMLAEVPREPYGLYLAKVSNAYAVHINGFLLDQYGDMEVPRSSDTKQPRYIAIPAGILNRQNQLRIDLRADPGRQPGVSRVVVGPTDVVRALHHERWKVRYLGPLTVAVFSALVGLIGLLLWSTQDKKAVDGSPGRDVLYLYGALAEFFWVFRVTCTLVEIPPVPSQWWDSASSLSLAAWGSFTVLFAVHLVGWNTSRPRMLRFLQYLLVSLMFAGCIASALAWRYGLSWLLTLWYGVLGMVFLYFGAKFVAHAFTASASRLSRLLASAIVVNVLSGLVDLYNLRIAPGDADSSTLYYTSVLFGAVSLVVVITRFRAATAQAHHLMATLTERVSEKERELNSSFQRLETLAREQERTRERTRILRDMHDGVGAHISAAIRQLQSGQTSNDLVLLTLRDSLDQLKLSIDAMNLAPGDITALLANVRYRLGSRFSAMHLELQWAVEELPTLAYLDAAAMRQLQFIVFEALSNVMQHARATTLRLEAAVEPSAGDPDLSEVCVRISDNGVGFEVRGAGRRGLATMGERARAIGARLAISSQPGATVVELRFPLYAPTEVPAKR